MHNGAEEISARSNSTRSIIIWIAGLMHVTPRRGHIKLIPVGHGRTFPLSESFMFFFNIWLVFIIIHLGNKFLVIDVITRFIHAPYALAWLSTAVLLGLMGMILKKPVIRIIGNMAACVWWGTVWMLYLITLKTILTLAFSIYLLPLVVSVTVITQNYQLLTKKEGQRQKTDPVK